MSNENNEYGYGNPYYEDNSGSSFDMNDVYNAQKTAMNMGDSGMNTASYYDNGYSGTVYAGSGNNGYSDGGYDSPYVHSTVPTNVDDILNSALTKSFLFMFIALLVTGITALFMVSSGLAVSMVLSTGGAGFAVIALIEIALVYACTATIKQNNAVLSGILFFVYSAINGATFSVIFMVFQLASIVSVFITTALVFGIMAFFGATVKKDLSGWGRYLVAGLVGILLASIVNVFLGATMVDLAVTVIGVIIFIGFTAYDVQKIQKMSRSNIGLSTTVIGLYGAMQLYLDFINLFIKILRLTGRRRR